MREKQRRAGVGWGCVARFHADVFERGGVAREKIVVVPEAVDTEFFSPDNVQPFALPGACRAGAASRRRGLVLLLVTSRIRRAGRRPGEFVFLSVFKWEHRKGYDVLLRAFLREFGPTDNVRARAVRPAGRAACCSCCCCCCFDGSGVAPLLRRRAHVCLCR